MPTTMSLKDSRHRAEQAYIMREVGMQSWSKIRDALGFKSHGAAQLAVKRYAARNPLPNAEAAATGIVERKRATIGIAMSSLAQAQKAGDHMAVARLVDVITRADAEMARLYGLGSETVNVNHTLSLDEYRDRLLAMIDGQVVGEPKALES